jgi:hypothetical protein
MVYHEVGEGHGLHILDRLGKLYLRGRPGQAAELGPVPESRK